MEIRSLDRKSTLSFNRRSTLLRKVRVMRALFGLALGALAMVVWLRMVMPQVRPKHLLTDAIPNSVNSDFRSVNALSGLKSSANIIDLHPASSISHSDFRCSSRSQQYWYRKEEYELSLPQAFAAALADYTRMFSRCGGYGEHEPDPGCQYIVYYEGWEGLGNRMLSLVTAFAYALVTNRALLTVADRGHLGAVLCEPFPNTTWILPSTVMTSLLSQSVSVDVAITSRFRNITAVHVNLRHSQSADVRAFFDNEAQQGLRNVPWLIWESNQYYVPRLFMLPNFWTTLTTWFPDVSRVFTQLGRFLCVPRNEVWDTIRKLQDAEMLQVGIQLRRSGLRDDAEFSEPVYQRVMGCVEDLVNTSASVLVTSLQSVYWEKMRERWKGGPRLSL